MFPSFNWFAAQICLFRSELRQVRVMYRIQNMQLFVSNLKVNYNMENHNSCDDLFDWSEWRSIRDSLINQNSDCLIRC